MADVDPENPGSESHFFSVSVRAWLALIVTLTACTMSLFKIEIKEPLYTLSVAIMSFYFASKNSGNSRSNMDQPK